MPTAFHYEPFHDLERAFDEALNHQWNQHQMHPAHPCDSGSSSVDGVGICAFRPRMDLHEDSTRNIVTAIFEVPGIRKDNIQLDVNNGRLTISAESKLPAELDEKGYMIRERRYGQFSRTLSLPPGVVELDIEAKAENGLLIVTFPSSAHGRPPRG